MIQVSWPQNRLDGSAPFDYGSAFPCANVGFRRQRGTMQATQGILRPAACRVLGVCLCLLWGGLDAAAQPPAVPAKVRVSELIILGSERMPQDQIKVLLKTKVGEEYNPATVDDDVRELYKTKRFSVVQSLKQEDGPDRVKVFFVVREVPNKITKVTFRGANHIKEKELRDLTGLAPDKPLMPNHNIRCCQDIEQKYQEMGRPYAHCTLVKGRDLGDTEVIFDITEGPVVKVRSIQFVGNKFVSGPVLATHIHSAAEFLYLLGGKYNEQVARGDVGELEKWYRGYGFQDVKVSLETKRSADGHEVTLIFHIHEGQQYRLQDVPKVNGATTMPHEQLEALSLNKAGDYLNENKIKMDMERIKAWYGYHGQDVHVVNNYVWLPDTPGVCNVQYQVVEQQPARVGYVYVVGNERTKMNVILRQVPLFPGQILTYPDLMVAQNNLQRLGIFTSGQDGPPPKVEVIPGDDESGFKDILVDVREANTGSLMFGLGVNSNSGLLGTISLNERNFDIMNPPTSLAEFLNGSAWRGAGQQFNLTAMPGTQLQQYIATFREPYLFDTPNNMTDSAYYFTRMYNEYTEQREGGRVTLGRQLNRFWNASLGLRVENVAVHNVSSLAPIDYQSVVGNNFQIGFRANVIRDSRDNYIRPTSGSHLELWYEEVTGEHTFPLTNMIFNKYFTTFQRADGSGRQVLVYHGQTGWAGTTTPVYERFFAGGFTTIRGFQFRGVGPNINGFMVGGDYLLMNSLEYQVPVKADDKIFLVGFVDSGTVSRRIEDLETYRVSVGFGVRFVVPMLGPMPIALDFGFPVHQAPTDIKQVFNFFMGFSH